MTSPPSQILASYELYDLIESHARRILLNGDVGAVPLDELGRLETMRQSARKILQYCDVITVGGSK